MKSIATSIFILFSIITFSQQAKSYTAFIQLDTSIKWAAECDKVLNLSPKVQEYSLKKWYLDKLNSGGVTAYKFNADQRSVTAYKLSIPGLGQPQWLKGTRVELSPYKYPQEWYYIDPSLPADDYNRYKARAGKLNLDADSCCGCDKADAFRAKQILTYKNGAFNIYNVFISPLCIRKTPTPPADWYPLCNVAYNNLPEGKKPLADKDIILLNSNSLDYDFSRENKNQYDSVLTVYRPALISMLIQDLNNGNIKAFDYETGEQIQYNNFLTWKMATDTIPVYDINDPAKLDRMEVVQKSRVPESLSRIRIEQEHWFDFKTEKLYSVIKSIILIEAIYLPDGNTIRGYRPFCEIKPS
jgi:hypothetical protein